MIIFLDLILKIHYGYKNKRFLSFFNLISKIQYYGFQKIKILEQKNVIMVFMVK